MLAMIRSAPCLLAALTLAGCATGGPMALSTGSPPAPSEGGYVLAAGDGELAAVTPLVDGRLRALGLQPAAGGSAGRYLVELGYSERPLTVGAFDQAQPPETRDGPEWRMPPARRHWWTDPDLRVCGLSVSVADARTGSEVYRAWAVERLRKNRCAEAAPRLVAAALAEIPLPPRN